MPENRIFVQYCAPQTNAMKDQILKELATPESKVTVIFAIIAMEIRVNTPSIRHVIHMGPPHTIRQYFQETRQAGRDGCISTAIFYWMWEFQLFSIHKSKVENVSHSSLHKLQCNLSMHRIWQLWNCVTQPDFISLSSIFHSWNAYWANYTDDQVSIS